MTATTTKALDYTTAYLGMRWHSLSGAQASVAARVIGTGESLPPTAFDTLANAGIGDTVASEILATVARLA